MDLWITGAEPWISAWTGGLPTHLSTALLKMPVTHKLHSYGYDDHIGRRSKEDNKNVKL